MKYTKEDVENLKKSVCPTCVSKDICVDKDEHWFMSCPKIFNLKLGFTDGVYRWDIKK